MLNKVILIGRLTKAPNSRVLQIGTSVSTFTLAVDRNFKSSNGERGTDFIPIVAWGKTAELCGKYLYKGMKTAISGRIQTRTYDTEAGEKRYVTEVIAEELVFLDKKKSEEDIMADNGFTEDEDLPF